MIVLLCGWVIATGMHWDIVQIAAWTRMWAQSLETESVARAFAATFSPDATCGICRVVQSAKSDRAEEPVALGNVFEKASLLPLALAQAVVIVPPASAVFRARESRCPPALADPPPLPPPRVAA